jgi:hypothetical protein
MPISVHCVQFPTCNKKYFLKFLEIHPHSLLHARPFLKCCQQLLLITTTNTFFYFITTILKLCHASTLLKTLMCIFCLVSKTHHIPNRVGMVSSFGSQWWNQNFGLYICNFFCWCKVLFFYIGLSFNFVVQYCYVDIQNLWY